MHTVPPTVGLGPRFGARMTVVKMSACKLADCWGAPRVEYSFRHSGIRLWIGAQSKDTLHSQGARAAPLCTSSAQCRLKMEGQGVTKSIDLCSQLNMCSCTQIYVQATEHR